MDRQQNGSISASFRCVPLTPSLTPTPLWGTPVNSASRSRPNAEEIAAFLRLRSGSNRGVRDVSILTGNRQSI
jgi:hypothetical protein